MSLLREEEDLDVAFARAARDLGDLDPMFVEKDYWVTQVLRALHAEYPGGFVFKGGTSLSKGYGIIERFSEDIDILVVPLAGASNRELEAHLRAITGAIAAHLGQSWQEARTPGRGRFGSRGDLLLYDPSNIERTPAGIRRGAVLLETGYVGGHEPSEMVTITPILCEPLGITPGDYEDTLPFDLRALQPVRTLVEKLFALHHIATLFLLGEQLDERFGRHFYDVYKLLDHQDTLRQLANRSGFTRLIDEVQRVSDAHFGGTTPRPEGGFDASPAFNPGERDDLRLWLTAKYDDSLTLLPRQIRPPTFGQVLKRVSQHSNLL